MALVDEDVVKEIKDGVNIVDVISSFTPLIKRGTYYIGPCPFHSGGSGESFKVDKSKGTYKCYSCGEGGDVIKFLTNNGKTFRGALAVLRGEDKLDGTLLTRPDSESVPLAEFKYTKPPGPVSPDNFVHKKFGAPKVVYTYLDRNKQLVGYVLRFEDPDGKKFILPYNYGVCTVEGWEYESKGKGIGKYFNIGDIVHKYLGFGDTKPIYGIEKVFANPKANVIVVEGEKCADYINKRFNPKHVVAVCWQGGANTVRKVDWSVLFGRRVFLCPDNDWDHTDKDGILRPYEEQPSPQAFGHIRDEILCSSEVYWVAIEDPTSKPSGADIADEDWGYTELVTFFKLNSKLISDCRDK